VKKKEICKSKGQGRRRVEARKKRKKKRRGWSAIQNISHGRGATDTLQAVVVNDSEESQSRKKRRNYQTVQIQKKRKPFDIQTRGAKKGERKGFKVTKKAQKPKNPTKTHKPKKKKTGRFFKFNPLMRPCTIESTHGRISGLKKVRGHPEKEL